MASIDDYGFVAQIQNDYLFCPVCDQKFPTMKKKCVACSTTFQIKFDDEWLCPSCQK
jgi:uncharacterized protein with PIN domain